MNVVSRSVTPEPVPLLRTHEKEDFLDPHANTERGPNGSRNRVSERLSALFHSSRLSFAPKQKGPNEGEGYSSEEEEEEEELSLKEQQEELEQPTSQPTCKKKQRPPSLLEQAQPTSKKKRRPPSQLEQPQPTSKKQRPPSQLEQSQSTSQPIPQTTSQPIPHSSQRQRPPSQLEQLQLSVQQQPNRAKISQLPIANIKDGDRVSPPPFEKSKKMTPRSPRAILNKIITKDARTPPSSGNSPNLHATNIQTPPLFNLNISEPNPHLQPRKVQSPRSKVEPFSTHSLPNVTLSLDSIVHTPFHPNQSENNYHSAFSPIISPRELFPKEKGWLEAQEVGPWVDMLLSLTDIALLDFFSVFQQFGISKDLLLDEIKSKFQGEIADQNKDQMHALLRVVVLWERTLGVYYKSDDPEFHQKIVNFLCFECSNFSLMGNGRILLMECGGKKEVGRGITAAMFSIFRKIQPTEFHSGAWDSSQKEKKAPKLTKLSKLFNRIASAVVESILFCCQNERESSLIFCIKLAKFLWKTNNFEGMAAVMSGLNSAAIRRIKPLWYVLPSKSKRLFEQMDGIVTQTRNFKQYHLAFSKIAPPAIPWIAPKLREIRFFYDGNQMTQGGAVNVDFLMLLGSAVSEIRQFQNHSYPPLQSPCFFLNVLLDSAPFSEDDHYDYSVTLFPHQTSRGPFVSSASSPALGEAVPPPLHLPTTLTPPNKTPPTPPLFPLSSSPCSSPSSTSSFSSSSVRTISGSPFSFPLSPNPSYIQTPLPPPSLLPSPHLPVSSTPPGSPRSCSPPQ